MDFIVASWIQIRIRNTDSTFFVTLKQHITAGPESLEYYFQKGALLGQKAALNLWYIDTRPNS